MKKGAQSGNCRYRIQHRRLTRTAARQSVIQKNYRSILEGISDAFFSLDNNLVVTYFNHAAEVFLGRSRKELLGRPLFDSFPEARGSIFEQKYRHAVEQKIQLSFEAYFEQEPYQNWYEVRVYPQENGISVFFQIVTQRKKMEAALQESKEMYASLLASLNDALVSFDFTNQRLIHINPAAEELYGQPLEDLYKSSRFWVNQVHPQDLSRYHQAEEALAQDGKSELEYRLIRPDGSIRWVLDRSTLVMDNSGIPQRVDRLLRDITQRITAEQALTQAQKRHELILETISEGIVMVDPGGQILYANQGAEKILCLKRDDILHRYFQEREWRQIDEFLNPYPPDQLPLALALGKKVTVTAREHGLIDPDGELKWLSVNAVPLLDENGDVSGAIASFRDITRQKQAERHIRFQAYLLDTVGQAAVAFDLSHKIIYANRYAELLYGWSKAELTGKPSFETIVPTDSLEQAESIQRAVVQGQSWSGEISLQRKDGTRFISFSTMTPIYEESVINGYLGISIDISDRKHAEERERQLRVLAEALRDTAAALTSTLNFKEVFERILTNVGKVVAHDASNLMLVEGDEVFVALHQGYQDVESQKIVENLRFNKNLYPPINWMIEQKRPLVISQTDESPLWNPEPGLPWVKSYAGVPLMSKGHVIGFLNLDSRQPGYFSDEDAMRLQAFADQVVLAVENARLYEEVEQLSVTDPLTGVYNRRGLFRQCIERIEEARRVKIPIAVVVADIDNFKEINDAHGHLVGDQVLVAVARRMKNRLRPSDVIGRYGGDEFVLLLMDVDQEGAQIITDRIRNSITSEPVHAFNQPVFIEVSVGLYAPDDEDLDFASLLQKADQALYRSKPARNRHERASIDQ